MENSNKILLCGENAEERRKLGELLKKVGYRNITEASGGENAMALIAGGDFSLVITDLWLTGLDGIGIIRGCDSLGLSKKPSFILIISIR